MVGRITETRARILMNQTKMGELFEYVPYTCFMGSSIKYVI